MRDGLALCGQADRRATERPRWYCFEILHNGRRAYIGKCETTEAEIRDVFPWCEIVGNAVTVFAPPPKARRA